MERLKNEQHKFLFDLIIIFLFGNFVIGIFESISFEYGYKFFVQLNSMRLFILYTLMHSVIGIGYAIFSFIVLYRDILIVKNKKGLKVFLIFYYVLFVYILSYFHYISPISYAVSFPYNGISNKNISIDIKTQLKQNYAKIYDRRGG